MVAKKFYKHEAPTCSCAEEDDETFDCPTCGGYRHLLHDSRCGLMNLMWIQDMSYEDACDAFRGEALLYV